jgi:hypothetical protein
MLKIKKITMKNFMSFGNVPQEVDFDNSNMTLILGENRDITNINHSNNSKNGIGKCLSLNTTVKVKNTKTGEIYDITVGDLYELKKKKDIL